jgi:hypothetical protein
MSSTSINVHARDEGVKLEIYHSNYGSRFTVSTGPMEITFFVDSPEEIAKTLNPLSWKITDHRDDEEE